MEFIEQIKEKTSAILDEVIAIRRTIHQNPELSFEEYETSAFVSAKLDEWGIKHTTGIVKTGISGVIEPEGEWTECIGLRADLDALPILEKNETEYVSKNEGIMHACGHDVHTAMLLGALHVIQEMRGELRVAVKFIFQPGEEKLPGGASLMIKEGILEQPKMDKIFALHVFPELEVGKVGLRPGMYMASCDEIRMTVKGKGGHGAMPHQTIDPILISAHLITALQQVVSRKCPPQVPSVLSFGRIEGLGATNVIPNEVKLEGTFRTMNEEWRAQAHKEIKKISTELVQSMGGTIDVDLQVGYPYLENDPQLTEEAKQKAVTFFGEDNVIDLPLRLTGEDFAYFSQNLPATFIRVGVRNEAKGIIHSVHNERFDIDEKAMLTGMRMLLSQIFLS